MSSWKTMIAVVVAATMVTAPVWAQTSTTPSDTSKGGTTSGTSGSSGTMSKDSGTSGSSSSTGTMSKDSGTSGSSGTMSKDTGASSTGEMKSGHKAGRSRMSKGGGNAEQVKAVQQALKDKGHDPGSIDGRMGPKTQQALKEFQKAEGLKETGRIDSETMTKLGVEGKTSATGSSSPAASPATDKSMPAPSGSSTSGSSSSSGSSSMPSNTGTSSGTGTGAGSSSTGGSTGAGAGSSPTSPSTGGSTK